MLRMMILIFLVLIFLIINPLDALWSRLTPPDLNSILSPLYGSSSTTLLSYLFVFEFSNKHIRCEPELRGGDCEQERNARRAPAPSLR